MSTTPVTTSRAPRAIYNETLDVRLRIIVIVLFQIVGAMVVGRLHLIGRIVFGCLVREHWLERCRCRRRRRLDGKVIEEDTLGFTRNYQRIAAEPFDG